MLAAALAGLVAAAILWIGATFEQLYVDVSALWRLPPAGFLGGLLAWAGAGWAAQIASKTVVDRDAVLDQVNDEIWQDVG